MSIVTKIGSRGVPEPKHLPRVFGNLCRREFEEVGGKGGEGEGEGEGVKGVGRHSGRPGGVETPKLGCNFVEGLCGEVWLLGRW